MKQQHQHPRDAGQHSGDWDQDGRHSTRQHEQSGNPPSQQGGHYGDAAYRGGGGQDQFDSQRGQQGDDWQRGASSRDRYPGPRGGHDARGGYAPEERYAGPQGGDYGNPAARASSHLGEREGRGYSQAYGSGRDFDDPYARQSWENRSPYGSGADRHGHGVGRDEDWSLSGPRGGHPRDAGPSWESGRPQPHVDWQGHGPHPAHHDPDYWQWRNEQVRQLDREYADWREHRYQRFSNEFDEWRRNRETLAGSGSSAGVSNPSSGSPVGVSSDVKSK